MAGKTGEEILADSILACSQTIYAVPGYPVSDLITLTRATLVINEKVALEYALGDSLAGRRSCVIVKHVGMNALVDPLVHATFQGLIGGVIIVCGDDVTVQNTMTAQNSRTFGPVASVPVLEGVTGEVVKEAFHASEKFSRVSVIRVTSDELTREFSPPGDPDTPRRCQSAPGGSLADPDLTMYGRAVRAGEQATAIRDAGYAPLGFSEIPLTAAPVSRTERGYVRSLCVSCPYRGLFEMMQTRGLYAICDTGCSLFAMNQPFSFGRASYGMGSAVAVGARSTGVALLGDYALLHSGIQGLISVYTERLPLLCIVMVNGCMGMTGGQPTPDPAPYIGFADPVICDAADLPTLDQFLMIPDRPVTLLVYGRCPEVIDHETVAC